MSHHETCLHLLLFQDNASFGSTQLFNCTIGRLVRMSTDNNDEEEVCEREDMLAGVHVGKLTVNSGGIGINFGHVDMNRRDPLHSNNGISVNLRHAAVDGKKVSKQFHNCNIEELILKSSK